MISQITAIEPRGSFNGSQGLMYKFQVTFADGMSGEANSKSQTPPYRVGETANYEQTRIFQGNPCLKVGKPNQGGGFPQQPQQPQYTPPPVNQPPAYQPPPQNAGNGRQSPFENGLNRLALLWCHCWNKSGEIAGKVGGLTPEQRQSACASLFIEANKNGTGALAMPAVAPAAPAPRQPAPGTYGGPTDNPTYTKPKPGPDGQAFPTPPPQENIDEDVPF